MDLPITVRRVIYRSGYRALQGVWFIQRPELVGVKCVITDRRRVLLVRHTYGRRRWDLPGGKVERAEPPLQTARREMCEELGIRVQEWESLGEIHMRMDHRHDTIHLFRVELRTPVIRLDRGELSVARWFPRDGLPTDLAPHAVPILARAEPRR